MCMGIGRRSRLAFILVGNMQWSIVWSVSVPLNHLRFEKIIKNYHKPAQGSQLKIIEMFRLAVSGILSDTTQSPRGGWLGCSPELEVSRKREKNLSVGK